MKVKILIAVIVTSTLLGIIAIVTNASNKTELNQIDLKTKQQEIDIKDKRLKQNEKALEDAKGDAEKLRQVEEENKKLQNEIKDLQAKKAEKMRIAALEQKSLAERALNAATGTQTAYAASGGYMTGCGDNADAAFIYGMESGGRVPGRCNPGAVNEIGCRGIGQACPGGKLPCGADYACQNAFFTKYAMDRYGSWANAKAFWLANNWW